MPAVQRKSPSRVLHAKVPVRIKAPYLRSVPPLPQITQSQRPDIRSLSGMVELLKRAAQETQELESRLIAARRKAMDSLFETIGLIGQAFKATEWELPTDHDSVAPSPELRERAKSWVVGLANTAAESHHAQLPIPEFDPCADGSIDIHWRNAGSRDLLVNLAVGGVRASFYGESNNSEPNLNGITLTSEDNGFLVSWLLAKNVSG